MRADDTGPLPWMNDGACRGEDPELFFPFADGARQIAEAISVCHGCGVEAECLQYALRHRVQHGVWGGRTAPQRLRTLRADAHRRRVDARPDPEDR